MTDEAIFSLRCQEGIQLGLGHGRIQPGQGDDVEAGVPEPLPVVSTGGRYRVLVSVPFYLQPTLGGNDDLRGYQRYRFYANNAFYATLEHRWHSFSGMDVALFVDAGKVANDARLLYREDLRWSGGIGFRFKLSETVIMRIDQAYGNEGYRFMWTFNNIF